MAKREGKKVKGPKKITKAPLFKKKIKKTKKVTNKSELNIKRTKTIT